MAGRVSILDKRWKAIERKAAKYIGGERVPITGRQRGDAPDIKHNWLSVEVKTRNKLPEWILNAMDQAKASNPGPKLPVAILHQKGQQIGDALICMPLRDFRERFL